MLLGLSSSELARRFLGDDAGCTAFTNASMSSSSNLGFSIAGNRPPLVCFLKKISFAVVAAQLTGTGMTSFGNVEYPNGFSMNGNRGGGPPTIFRKAYNPRGMLSVSQ